jgi:diguanylate cyclase (GGDEF)-like protein
MDSPTTIGGSLATRRERIGAIVLVAFLAGITAVALPSARVPLPPMTPFLPMFGMLACSSDVLTAFLFLSQARVARSRALMILALSYFFSSTAIAVHVLVYPGVFSATGLFSAGSQTMMWFWTWWHAGFPLLLIAYATRARYEDHEDIPSEIHLWRWALLAGMVIIVVGALLFATIEYERWLPQLISSDTPGLIFSSHVGPIIDGVIIGAIAVLVFATRLRTVTNLWLAVALVASLFDVILTSSSAYSYTVGWYLSRVMSLSTSMVVLVTFLRSLGKLFLVMARQSSVDGLTGLANRRAFDEFFASQISLAVRTSRPVSVILLDVDWFKKYNDTYGHPAGDETLRKVARAIDQVLKRGGDYGARYGGEEFAVVLPSTDREGARRVAQRIGNHVRAMKIEHSESAFGHVTVSLGVATYDSTLERERITEKALLERADGALYRAKHLGRDQCVVDFEVVVEAIPAAQPVHVEFETPIGSSIGRAVALDVSDEAVSLDEMEILISYDVVSSIAS